MPFSYPNTVFYIYSPYKPIYLYLFYLHDLDHYLFIAIGGLIVVAVGLYVWGNLYGESDEVSTHMYVYIHVCMNVYMYMYVWGYLYGESDEVSVCVYMCVYVYTHTLSIPYAIY
jgi:hypothetical protein